MIIQRMKETHIDGVLKILNDQYKWLLSQVDVLPDVNYEPVIRQILLDTLENSFGIVGLVEDQVVGYMTGFGPIDQFFGTSKGYFVPLSGHGTITKNRYKIYNQLIKAFIDRLAQEKIYSFGVGVYKHDTETLEQFHNNGFGTRCMDAMTKLVPSKIDLRDQLTICEMEEVDYLPVYKMSDALRLHLTKSPVCMILEAKTYESFVEAYKESQDKYLVVRDKEKTIGFIKYGSDGENFITTDKSVANICGAYLEPDYRGQGIYKQLLHQAMNTMIEEGKSYCGVDCETLNHQAFHFWSKHFTPYCYSVVRRIDERYTP